MAKRPDFDPRTANDATTADEAMELAKAWANGQRSWWNLMMDQEPRDRLGPIGNARQRTIAVASEADAAEVAKWAALVPAFLAMEIVPPVDSEVVKTITDEMCDRALDVLTPGRDHLHIARDWVRPALDAAINGG